MFEGVGYLPQPALPRKEGMATPDREWVPVPPDRSEQQSFPSVPVPGYLKTR